MRFATKPATSLLQSMIDLPWGAPLYGTLPAPVLRKP
jgi:hypothetical protein